MLISTYSSDVIPWQCWTRYPDDCSQSRAVFVDVDFPDLIQKKRQVVLNTPELMSHLSRVETKDNKHNVLLRSDHYYQVGCDLRHTSALQKALESIVDVRECVFMFVAEVSITYMETETADPLIHWASTIGDGKLYLGDYQPAYTALPRVKDTSLVFLYKYPTLCHVPNLTTRVALALLQLPF